jgi:microsomal dipeptidase-like Zn-dependent dipeptidase
MTATPAEALHGDSLVVDVHTHGPRFVPQPFRAVYRFVNRATMPPDLGFDVLAPAGVDVVVAKAVGDPVVTRWYRGGAWAAVVTQIDQLVDEIRSVGGDVVTDSAGLRAAHSRAKPGLLLGIEGADAIGRDLDRVDQLYRLGVRMIVLVHLGDNQVGTTALPWQRYVGRLPVHRRQPAGT